ncbi:MAG: hypothetical protein G3I10_03875 [Ferrovum sp.]|nr:hypothetical protein [Ferrovum sp.]
MAHQDKRLVWIGGSKKDLLALPILVRKFCGAGVLEVVENDAGGTYPTPNEDMDIIRSRLKIAEALAKELHHGKTQD